MPSNHKPSPRKATQLAVHQKPAYTATELAARATHGPPDFTINLVDPDRPRTILVSHKVHRTLLLEKIDYFKALFSGSFADSELPTAQLDSSIITPQGLSAVVSYIYTLHAIELPILVPALLDVITAADFLQVSDLKELTFAHIEKLASDPITAPTILATISDNNTALDTLTKTKNIANWKRPVLDVAEEVVAATVACASGMVQLVELWEEVVKLQRKVETSPSKEKARWKEEVFTPLKKGIAQSTGREVCGYGANILKRFLIVNTGFQKRADLKLLVKEIVQNMDAAWCREVWEFLLGFAPGDTTKNIWGNEEEQEEQEEQEDWDIIIDDELVELAMHWWRGNWAGCVLRGEFDKWPIDRLQNLADRLGVKVEELLLNVDDGRKIGRKTAREPLEIRR